MSLSRYSIRTRLTLGFATMLAMALVIAATGMYQMSKANRAMDHVVHINMTKIELLTQMSDSIHVVSRVVRSMALLSDRAAAERERPKITDAQARYAQAFDALRKMPLDSAGQGYVRDIGALHDAVTPMDQHYLEMSQAGDANAAIRYMLDVAGPPTTKLQDTIRAFAALQKQKSANDEASAKQAYEEASTLMFGLALAALVGGTVFAVGLTRSVTLPLARAIDMAHDVAAGDLTAHVAVAAGDRSETGSLLRALNEMSAGLNTLVTQVREGAHTLTVDATGIADGNLDLSSRTEQQAGALERTTSSMAQLSSTVKANADHALNANRMAASTSQIAAHGGTAVGKVVEVMATIESSSVKIVEIIGVIDAIAFQTNILAFNAAVEAARAGEQGRGFAVVASEVRTLAQRSATAAKEIKALIDGSVSQIKQGSDLARDAGATMQDVVGGIKDVSGLVAEIAAASAQQSLGIEHTHRAVSELDEITRHNVAQVAEVSATAASLKDEAIALEQTVSRFELKRDDAHTGGRPALSPHAAPVRRLPA